MPPSKRVKKSSSVAAAAPPPPPPALVSVLKDEPNVADIKLPTTTTSATTESALTPSDDSDSDSIDPALLDEEETPGASDPSASGGVAVPNPEKTWQFHGKGYNALKTFKGQVYSGMAVGGSHTWKYDEGVWKETKEEPDLWGIDYAATKRRAGARKAPRGSGVPVGTEYHWLVVAHQYVKKTDANTYDTHLVGSKYKLAHKAASSSAWSINTVKGQREREIELLEDAKRRVQGLPPVPPREKVKVEKQEKGQQKLDSLFMKAGGSAKGGGAVVGGKKRKREEETVPAPLVGTSDEG